MFANLDPERGACQDMEVAWSPCSGTARAGRNEDSGSAEAGKESCWEGTYATCLGTPVCPQSPTLSSKTEKA